MKRGLAAALAAVSVLAAVALPARAQHMEKSLFLDMTTSGGREQTALLDVYLRGVLAGIEAADILLRRAGRRRLACPPPDAHLTGAWLRDALEDYYREYPDIPDNVSVALSAQFLLQERFPCPHPASR